MIHVRLPVAGVEVGVRLPAGADDMLLLESGPVDLRVALALLARIASDGSGVPLDASALPITDVDVLLLCLRQWILGDLIRAEQLCGASGCQARVDVTFSIASYLEHDPPVTPADVTHSTDAGWYGLTGEDVAFRLPCAADQLAIARDDSPEEALLQRCVRPAAIDDDVRRRVEEAMEALAPSLFSELQGTCPHCGASVQAEFDPVQYVLRELRARAASLYDEVCAIAHHYHWSEAEILSLPAERRIRYADLAFEHARQEREAR